MALLWIVLIGHHHHAVTTVNASGTIKTGTAATGATLDKCPERHIPPTRTGDYDFIVVGGGTGGAIVAARLSEKFDVLLLESGERLYDDATLSMKYLNSIIMGTDLSTIIDPVKSVTGKITNAITNLFHSLIHKKEGESDSESKGDTDSKDSSDGGSSRPLPKGLPHIQETPFFAFHMCMSDACHYYPTVPQIFSQKREIDYPRGNVLGGSSAANTMVYFRGTDRDFNSWLTDFGLTGWSYEDVLPYFRKFENNLDVADSTQHGHSGPINITVVQNHFRFEASDAWHAAARKLGWGEIKDASNMETQYGASQHWQSFVGPNGKRSDTSDYLRMLDARGRICWNERNKNACKAGQRLHVWTNTFATKILIDPEQKRAFGVEYVQSSDTLDMSRTQHPKYDAKTSEGVKHRHVFNKWNKFEAQKGVPTYGAPVDRALASDMNRTSEQYIPEGVADYSSITHEVRARYEVVLATGAVATPQLLMLSGIGPADHLRERSIPLVADLPVGKRLQDHQEVFINYEFPDEYEVPFDMKKEAAKGMPTFRAHLRGERTLLSSNMVPSGLEGSSAGPTGTVPKWHLHHTVAGALENFDWQLSFDDESVDSPTRVARGATELFTWKGFKIHGHNCELSGNHAYGRLELRSRDPFQPPFVDPRYGSSDEDNAEIVNCWRTVRQIMNTVNPKFAGRELGPCAKAETDAQMTQCVRNKVWGHHISGSAPMANCTTPFAVTDPRARVYHVDGLRVADISLFPTIPHGNPAGVVMMMAEKISDMIIEDYRDRIHSGAHGHDDL